MSCGRLGRSSRSLPIGHDPLHGSLIPAFPCRGLRPTQPRSEEPGRGIFMLRRVIRLRTQPPSVARRNSLRTLRSSLRASGSRPAPAVPALLSLFGSIVQLVVPVLTRVSPSKPVYTFFTRRAADGRSMSTPARPCAGNPLSSYLGAAFETAGQSCPPVQKFDPTGGYLTRIAEKSQAVLRHILRMHDQAAP
jgi:hypothetical protein